MNTNTYDKEAAPSKDSIPINRKRIAVMIAGALFALATVIAVVVGLLRAEQGVIRPDVPDRGPVLNPGEVQRVPNLPPP